MTDILCCKTDYDTRAQFEYLGYKHVADQLIFVREEELLQANQISQSGKDLLQNLITNSEKKPVLCLSGNPNYVAELIDSLNEDFDFEDFFVLGDDCRQEKYLKPNIGSWPFALLMQQMSGEDYSKNFQKHFRIGVLCRHSRIHRLCLFEAIKPHVTEMDVVVFNRMASNVPVEVTNSNQVAGLLDQLPWSNNTAFLDLDQEHITYTKIDHPAWQACVNVTNESWHKNDLCFLTEKTWKAYANKCLTINFGSSMVPDQLEQYGFEIWKPFDPAIDYRDKIKVVVDVFKNNDIFKIYADNQDLIDHNYDLATSRQFACKLAVPTIEKIQQLFKL